MKKIVLSLVLAAASLTAPFVASAHWHTRVHYHSDDGVVYSNTIRPTVDVTFETDRNGRRVRVETTTRCVRDRLNSRNNHLRCLQERTSVRRLIVDEAGPVIDPIIERRIIRDDRGRRIIVTTTRTCTDARWNRRHEPVCFNWRTTVTREVVRRAPRSRSLDLNGDGRTDPWERLLFRSFRNALDN